MEKILIKADSIAKIYRTKAEDIRAVDSVSLDITAGEFVSIMGPSGSGKTSLLDMLGCLSNVSEGRLEIDGKEVSSLKEDLLFLIRREKFGFIFQEFHLIPTLTALENVEMGLMLTRKEGGKEKALETLKMVGLDQRADHLPRELSGGERQRVAIARALVTSPQILIADEPTGNLDSSRSEEIFSILKNICNQERAVIMATHDDQLGSRADRVLVLRDGKLQ